MAYRPTRISKRRSAAKLLALLSDGDWRRLVVHLGLGEHVDRNKVLKQPELLDGISNTELLDWILEEKGRAFAMVHDIMSFLEDRRVSARTTGEVINLSELKSLTPQQRGLVINWSERAIGRASRDGRLEALWERASHALDQLSQASFEERGRRRYRDRRGWMEAVEREPQRHADVLDLYVSQVKLVLGALPQTGDDALLKRIRRECLLRLDECEERQSWEDSGMSPLSDYREEKQRIAQFLERLGLMADVETSEDLRQLLALSIFRSLPQLFEVWVLCFVLRTVQEAGHSLTLEKVTDGVWDLKYAADRSPVARIDGVGWVFFQFKRPGTPAMPDFAIFPAADGHPPAALVLDAKLSELGGYGAGDYRRTYEAYSSLAARVAVLEHEDRGELNEQPGLLRAVRPGGPGAQRLREELFVGLRGAATALAVIDVSPSFANRLDAALARLATLSAGGHLDRRYVTFGSRAEIGQDLESAIRQGRIRAGGGCGTLMAPLKEKFEELRVACEPLVIVLATDAAFQDGVVGDLGSTGDLVWLMQFDELATD